MKSKMASAAVLNFTKSVILGPSDLVWPMSTCVPTWRNYLHWWPRRGQKSKSQMELETEWTVKISAK